MEARLEYYMRDPQVQAVKNLIETGLISLPKIEEHISSFTQWQQELFGSFESKSWVGKLTPSQIFTKTPDSVKRLREIGEMETLKTNGLVQETPAATAGHHRFTLTPSGLAVLYVMRELYKDNPTSRVINYSGMTRAQILESIPEPSDDRVLPPPHILRMFDGYEIENERPLDQELIDAVNAANSELNSYIEIGQ